MIVSANKPISKHELKHVTRKEILLGLRKITDLAYYSARNDYRGAIRDIYDIASELLEKEMEQDQYDNSDTNSTNESR